MKISAKIAIAAAAAALIVVLICVAAPKTAPAALPTPTLEPTPTPTPSPTSSPSPTPEPTPEITPYQGAFGASFPDVFTDGETVETENSYRSYNVSVTVERVETETESGAGLVYVIADVYIRDIECLGTAIAGGTFGGARFSADMHDMANDANAIIAISGDYYQATVRVRARQGLVIRNGEVGYARNSPQCDMLVLYRDGKMEAIPAGCADAEAVTARDPWQAWTFGPILVMDGEVRSEDEYGLVKENILSRNPRTVIGYYEPGHYCFVCVVGRFKYSRGLELEELGRLMQSLGVDIAYNLDGGYTSFMLWHGKQINDQVRPRNDCSDIIYIREPVPKEVTD